MRVLFSIVILLTLAISAAAQQSLTAGSPAPDFAAAGLDGKTYSLSQLQGKVVVLTFWSTRCPICNAEIPKLNQVVDRYREKNVVFLGVTMDNQSLVEPYLRKNPFNYSIVPNSFGIFLKYADKDASGNINMGFPAHFVIDKRGVITLRSSGWDKSAGLDAQIGRMLTSD